MPEQKRRKKNPLKRRKNRLEQKKSVGNCVDLDKTCNFDTFRVASRATVLHLELDWCSWMNCFSHYEWLAFINEVPPRRKIILLRMQRLGFLLKWASVKA